MTALVCNNAQAARFAGRLGHTFAPNPEHVGYKFLGHMQFIAGQPVE